MKKANKIKVLHLTFNMGVGGTEQVIRHLVRGMEGRDDVDSEVLCIDGYVGPLGEELELSGIPVHKLSRKPGFDWTLIASIRNRLREGRFDVVHCHQYTPWLYGWIAAQFTQTKVVFTEHGRFYPDRYRYKAIVVNPIVALLTPAIVAISSATRDALARYEFIPKRKINVIYNGITPLLPNEREMDFICSDLGIPPTDTIVGTVSRLDPVKNQAMMLRAFKRLLNKHKDSWLLIVGDGPSRPDLERLAVDIGIAHRTSFTGSITSPVNYFALMKVFMLSSHTEGTSMTLLEAMSLGIPIVATNVGGNSEVLKSEGAGVLVPPDDAQKFFGAVSNLLENSELYSSKSEGAKSIFKEFFSCDTMVTQYVSIYRSLKVKSDV